MGSPLIFNVYTLTRCSVVFHCNTILFLSLGNCVRTNEFCLHAACSLFISEVAPEIIIAPSGTHISAESTYWHVCGVVDGAQLTVHTWPANILPEILLAIFSENSVRGTQLLYKNRNNSRWTDLDRKKTE